jgi:hypothetical protein
VLLLLGLLWLIASLHGLHTSTWKPSLLGLKIVTSALEAGLLRLLETPRVVGVLLLLLPLVWLHFGQYLIRVSCE